MALMMTKQGRAMVRHTVRRVARLIGSLGAAVLGFVFALLPPDVFAAEVASSHWIIRAWGACLLIGGVVGIIAWYSRVLIIERLGLTMLITGLGALLLAQAAVTYSNGVKPTEVAGLGLVVMILGYMVARWQDVRASERLAQDAIREVKEVRGEY